MPKDIYLGRLFKLFRNVCWENKIDILSNSNKYNKTKTWRKKTRDRRSLKAAATNAQPEVEYNRDRNSVFSDPTFNVASALAAAQSYLVSADTVTATSTIPEDPTIKYIFAAAGSRMQVSSSAASRCTDIIIVKIPKYQVAILAKIFSTIVDQGVNSYSMSAATLATRPPDKCRASRNYGSKPSGEVNPPYLLNAPSSGDNNYESNPKLVLSLFILPHPCHWGSIMEMLIPPIHMMEVETKLMTMMSPTILESIHQAQNNLPISWRILPG